MAISTKVSVLEKILLTFLLGQKGLTSHLYQTISLHIPGLDPKVIEQTKQNVCESDCYIYEVFQAKTLCMILDISTLRDNLDICFNLCETHSGYSLCMGDFVRTVPIFMIVHRGDMYTQLPNPVQIHRTNLDHSHQIR